MDYEKLYKEALERAKKWYYAPNADKIPTYANKIISEIFPELEESEDERIRREMIEIIKNEAHEFPSSVIANKSNSWIAWLEKQGEQKPVDKVEPKFKVGDWIINNDKRIALPTQILKIEEYGYITLCGYISFDKVKTDYHLWTIQDAKDGDVLYHKSPLTGIEYIVMSRGINGHGNVDSYFRYNSKDGFDINVSSVFNTKSNDICPATKEQCDILFSKMKEAGYEWDAENKELRKIEQNTAWSERDEQYLLVCKNALAKYQTTNKWDAHIISHWLEDKLRIKGE